MTRACMNSGSSFRPFWLYGFIRRDRLATQTPRRPFRPERRRSTRRLLGGILLCYASLFKIQAA